jgi:hypothetical protein
MAHTNETANYHLSQFVGTDIPNPLVDYNGDMVKIDTVIKGVADASAGYASDIADLEIQNGSETLTTTAQTLSGAVNELDDEVGDLTTRMTTAEGKITADEGTLATAVGNISTLAGKVGTVEAKVGTAVLTTVAPDLSGAVNELKAEIDGSGVDSLATRITALETQNGDAVLVTTAQTLSGAINELAQGGSATVDADDVVYSNTDSGLTATNVQDAIDEVNNKIGASISISATGDGTKTWGQLINEIKQNASYDATKINNKSYISISTAGRLFHANIIGATPTFVNIIISSSKADIRSINMGGYYEEVQCASTGNTHTDLSSIAADNGAVMTLYI